MSAYMADRHCKGIGGIGFNPALNAQQPLDHSGNLLFGRPAVSGYGLFYP